MITAESIRAAGEALTPEEAHQIAERLRRQIGSPYDFVASAIEHDHPVKS